MSFKLSRTLAIARCEFPDGEKRTVNVLADQEDMRP